MNYGKPWEIPEVIDAEHWAQGPDGCDYDNIKDYILTGLLGFCGCGMPEEALKWLRGCLADIEHRTEVEWKQSPPVYQGRIYARMEPLPRGVEYLLWYWMDKLELIEHGGSVGGSWLTERGKHLLRRLEKIDLDDESE
jgi:hypothetical protein